MLAVSACSSDDDDGGVAVDASIPTPDPNIPVPTNGDDVFAYLQSGGYTGFSAESGVHASSGPHGQVRSFINPILQASLENGSGEHPVNAAVVKELYNAAGDTLTGWAVSVKVQEASDEGRGWYWYEIFSTTNSASPVADGTGVSLCTNCHGDPDEGGQDFVLVPFPLQ